MSRLTLPLFLVVTSLLSLSGCIEQRSPSSPAQPEAEPGMARGPRPVVASTVRGVL